MDIIYKQTSTDNLLNALNIENFYLKHLCAKFDSKITFCKEHHHTGFEIHFMNKGQQEYIIDKNEYILKNENILVIPPLFKHYAKDTQSYSSKFSITFSKGELSPFEGINKVLFFKANKRIMDNLNNALEESKIASVYSKQIISNSVYESLVLLLRLCGFNEMKACTKESFEDDRLILAKRYINDNIDFKITVSDVASHCCLGTKQLTRLFTTYEKITPLLYIQKQKIKSIELMMLDGYSLKDISEKMNFSSEYYLNTFYKKYAGISPGRYKKMHLK